MQLRNAVTPRSFLSLKVDDVKRTKKKVMNSVVHVYMLRTHDAERFDSIIAIYV